MADIDIDPFENMNRGLKSQLMNIFLFLQLPQKDHQLGNQHMNRKRLLEEESPKELNS